MPTVTVVGIREVLQMSPPGNLSAWRTLRRKWSRELRTWPAQQVIELGFELIEIHPWGRLTAYELVACHPSGRGGPANLDSFRGRDKWSPAV